MHLLNASEDVLNQLRHLLTSLTDDQFTESQKVLSSATIGQHVRHILECFTCFTEGNRTGTLNYDHRKRELMLETHRTVAMHVTNQISVSVQSIDLSKQLILETDFSKDHGSPTIPILTSAARELAYNIEHAIHHMALLKAAILQSYPHVILPEHFGIAYSTMKHRSKICAQ